MWDVTVVYAITLPHVVYIVQDTLYSTHWKVFDHLPCSLDLQLCDLHVLCLFYGAFQELGIWMR